MATVALAVVGQAIGTVIGGPIGGMIGATLGSMGGSLIDRSLAGRPKPVIAQGPRLADLYVTGSTEGAPIPRCYGRIRLGGQIIWATKIKETQTTAKVKASGGKGQPAQKSYSVTYTYSVSLAVAFCEGRADGIGTIYADGKPLSLATVPHRIYLGGEDQNPDPKIEAVEGAGQAPAYRGLVYVVFEDLPLGDYGNRVPVLTAEVMRRPPAAIPDRPALEDLVTAVTMIPGMGEYAYATERVHAAVFGGYGLQNAISGRIDALLALSQLKQQAPACTHVSLVVAWHGTDLRLGACRIEPRCETHDKTASMPWIAGGLTRAQATMVSRDGEGRPLVGGAPADRAVVQMIQAIRAAGFEVTLYPFVMMDIPAGNGLPDPAGGAEQPAFPWRGRITCHPAPGRPDSPDRTAAAAAQVAAFFGTIPALALRWDGTTVTSRLPEWSFRRFILHCARLAEAAGGVDGFLIGSELVGLTTVRSDATTYPAVAHLRALAADVRAILGAGVQIGYAADWTEYANHRPADGSGDVLFPLDDLWADANIDFVGIDNYMPLADWRDGFGHRDAAAGARSPYDRAYLQANIEGGELYDWYYPTPAARDGQDRAPITDGLGEPWIHRPKDLRNWWGHAHHPRPGGVRASSPTAWRPGLKPIRFTEVGCPAVDRGANQPNVFVDPKSSESELPYSSRGNRDLMAQRSFLEAQLSYWRPEAGHNPASPLDGRPMVDWTRTAVWTWDARPWPDFPRASAVWRDAPNYRLGHWINGRLGLAPLADVVADLCAGLGVTVDVSRLEGLVEGYAIDDVMTPRDALATLARIYFFEGHESGGAIVFGPTASAPVARIASDAFVQGESGEYTRKRSDALELPAVLSLGFVDAGRAYGKGSVEVRRPDGPAASVTRVEAAVVLDDGEAAGIASALLYAAYVEREHLTGVLPPSALALDAGDIVTCDLDGRSLDVRIVRIGLEHGRPMEAVRADAGDYDRQDGTPLDRDGEAPAAVGVALALVLDLPTLPGQDAADGRPSLAAYTRPWSPVAVARSTDGQTFADVAVLDAPTVIGRLTADLPAGPAWRWDRVNSLFVEVATGAQLDSATDDAVLAGANAAAIRTPSGEWEIVQWQSATLLADRHYRLDRLLRGQLGTEAVMGAPTPAGAPFVVLGDSLVQAGGTGATWRFTPASLPADDPASRLITAPVAGAALRPYAPSQARLVRAGADLVLTWIRRTRTGGDRWDQVEVPLGEDSERYEVDILDGTGAVRRTLATDAPALTYTAAMQAEDFGGGVDALSVAIHQLSRAAGRGTALTRQLHV